MSGELIDLHVHSTLPHSPQHLPSRGPPPPLNLASSPKARDWHGPGKCGLGDVRVSGSQVFQTPRINWVCLVPDSDSTSKIPITEATHPMEQSSEVFAHTHASRHPHVSMVRTHRLTHKCSLCMSSWNPMSSHKHLSVEKNHRESSLQRK